MKTKMFISSVLVILTGVCIVGVTRLYGSPEYTARAEYSINWNQMGLGDDDYKPQEARQKYDRQIAKLKIGQAFIQELCQRCNIPESKADSVAKDVQRHLKIVRIGKIDNSDLYRVQCSNNDTNIALRAVNILSRRQVQNINGRQAVQGGKQTYSAFEERESADEERQKLQNELATLSQKQQQEYSSERQGRMQEIQAQLNQNEVTQDVSGLKAFVYLVETLSNPAEIQKRGVIDPH